MKASRDRGLALQDDDGEGEGDEVNEAVEEGMFEVVDCCAVIVLLGNKTDVEMLDEDGAADTEELDDGADG